MLTCLFLQRSMVLALLIFLLICLALFQMSPAAMFSFVVGWLEYLHRGWNLKETFNGGVKTAIH